MSIFKTFFNGIFKENPVLILLLGMCPTLATSSSAKNAIFMGLATTFVLMGSNIVVSLFKSIIPGKVRIPCFIVVIATFVTLLDLLLQAYAPPALVKSLGIFLPLITVNCIVLGRAEAFASKNNPFMSAVDGLGMGLGFTLTLTALGAVREFLADGTLFELIVVPNWQGFALLKFAPGAFIVLGVFIAVVNYVKIRAAEKEGRRYDPPAALNCATCNICKIKK
ncbi:MAG: electron transport complex subunit E [Victivallales bacterium]|nr:electron transport complex subunit E [Victivallales bacterium]